MPDNSNAINELRPTKQGIRAYEEWWQEWWLFPRITEEEAQAWIERNGLGAWYGGPGREFVRAPFVQHSLSRTLITQSGGLDI